MNLLQDSKGFEHLLFILSTTLQREINVNLLFILSTTLQREINVNLLFILSTTLQREINVNFFRPIMYEQDKHVNGLQ